MNKKVIIVISVILITIIASIVIVNVLKESENMENNNIQTEEIISESIIVRTKNIASQSSTKSIEILLPEFQNLDDSFESYINTKIYNDLNYGDVYDEVTYGLEDDEIGKFTYEVTYDRYNCWDYVSIVANQYIHLGNGRPRIQKKCYVIDAKENTTMTLNDVFQDKFNYEKAIVDEINKQAKDNSIELVGGNGLSKLNKEQQFYIKDENLVICFEASEIAAAAVGELEFVMPFEMVEHKFILQ